MMGSDKSETARVTLLCGKTGSGKTTYARQLEEQGAVRFSLDEWMLRFYGDGMSRELFNQRVQICEQMFFDLTEALVRRGIDVVIDHGFWRREARARARQRLANLGARGAPIFFSLPHPILRDPLQARHPTLPPGTYEITAEMVVSDFHPR